VLPKAGVETDDLLPDEIGQPKGDGGEGDEPKDRFAHR
jgi:hypothetical protein